MFLFKKDSFSRRSLFSAPTPHAAGGWCFRAGVNLQTNFSFNMREGLMNGTKIAAPARFVDRFTIIQKETITLFRAVVFAQFTKFFEQLLK